MSNNNPPTCSDCYFRRAGLCALAGDVACPTFRAARRDALTPPLQPPLVPRAQNTLVAAAAG